MIEWIKLEKIWEFSLFSFVPELWYCKDTYQPLLSWCSSADKIRLTVVKYFRKNAPKFFLHRNIFTNNPHEQAEVVAWQHFCENNFATKQRNAKFTIFHLQNKVVYSILLFCIIVAQVPFILWSFFLLLVFMFVIQVFIYQSISCMLS